MTRQEQAKAKRARRAARGPGFSNYSKGLPTSSDRRAKRSNERAAEREKAREEAEAAEQPSDAQA